MKNHYLVILFILASISIKAQNPIVPPGVYIPNPSAHVWNDGKLYVYSSRDESPKQYSSWRYDVIATSDLKTWTITEKVFSSPGVWNNHGSLVEFNKQWYVFYHRTTHGSRAMRKTCIEPITFNKDGSINEVEMTTQGAGAPLNALSKIDAERSCLLFGNVRIEANAGDNEVLTKIEAKDNAAYKYINFNDGVDSVMVGLIPGKFKGTIEVVLDNSWGPTISSDRKKSFL